MQPADSSQWTEEQRSEAFRQAVIAQLQQQTKHLDAIKTLMILFTVLAILGAVIYVLMAVAV